MWLQSGNVFFKHWHSLLLSSQKTEKLLLIPCTDNFSSCHPWMLLSGLCWQRLLETSLNSFIPALLRGYLKCCTKPGRSQDPLCFPLAEQCEKKLIQGMDFPVARSCCAGPTAWLVSMKLPGKLGKWNPGHQGRFTNNFSRLRLSPPTLSSSERWGPAGLVLCSAPPGL